MLAIQRSYDANSAGQYTLIMNQDVDQNFNIYSIVAIGPGGNGQGPGFVEVYDETGFTIRFRTYNSYGQLYNPTVITFTLYHLEPVGSSPVTL